MEGRIRRENAYQTGSGPVFYAAGWPGWDCVARSRARPSAFQDPGARERVALDAHLELGPVLGLGDDLEAAIDDDHGVSGTRRADAGAPVEGHLRIEGHRAVGNQEDLARSVADGMPEVIEGPLVGVVELLVDPPGAAKHFADLLTGTGEIDAGGIHHRGQAVTLMVIGAGRTE